jgi:hypothetical protein
MVEGFKVQDGLLFDAVRPGDEVRFITGPTWEPPADG